MRARFVPLVAVTAVLVGCGSTHTTTSSNRLTGGLDGATSAELDVESGATSITVQAASIGSDLYRVETPKDAGVKPSVVRNSNRVQVFLSSAGSGPAAVTVYVAEGVRWQIRIDGGATDLVTDLRDTKVSSVDFAAGDTRIRLDLPKASGTVPVQMNGGASEFTVMAPAGVSVQTSFVGGAASADLDGTSHSGIAGGTVFTPAGWAHAANRYDVVAHAGVSAFTLDRS